VTSLVTGANGFVGAAVVRALVADGQPVRALVRRGSDQRNLEGLGVELVEGDITVPDSLVKALKNCRYVFHVAADYRLWVPDPEPMYHVNVQGSVNVLEAAHAAGVEKVVHTSSVATLGLKSDGQSAHEDTPSTLRDMIGPYKRSKFLAEQAVRDCAGALALPVVMVNPSTPIGPGDIKATPTGRMILDAAAGRTPAYVDTGLNVVHVDDVARGQILAMRAGIPGERYILGGTDLSLKNILALVAAQVGRRPPTLRLPRRAILPVAYVLEGIARVTKTEPRVSVDSLRMAAKYMYFSSAKAERALGYRWRPPEEAISDAIIWFREHNYL